MKTHFVRTRISRCVKQLKYIKKLIYHLLKWENVGNSKLAAYDFHQKFNFFSLSLSSFWLRASKKLFLSCIWWGKKKKNQFYKGFFFFKFW